FFHARAGRARGFRLKDWSDFSSAPDHVAPPGWSDQIIGTGDGLTATFQLVKNYGSGGVTHQRVIRKPREETILVGVDHMQLLTGWSVETTTGLLIFAIPPTTGQVITAGFYFDVPVRFDDDQLNLSSEDNNTSKSEIPLVEIRVG
ncbi:MAG: DUF2460 domain-containing protein, partial [Alphaproteobacteria bacterium]|nr:DUF2460 domain-containing protein [Alphaproteobacteria bacterium]